MKDFHDNDPSYVYFLLSSVDLSLAAAGVSVPTLNRNVVHPTSGLPTAVAGAAPRSSLSSCAPCSRRRRGRSVTVAAARQLKQSLLRHLFTYGPTPFDRADRVALKETEIGPMPEQWELVRLAEVAQLYSGGTPSKQRPDFWAGAIPWASPKDLKQPRLSDVEDHISKAGLEDGSRLAPSGTVFIVVRGMILSRDVPVALTMVPMAFNQDMKAIVSGARLNSEYLLTASTAHKRALFPEISSAAHGTKRIGTSAIENFLLPLPPLREQRQIAAMLLTVDEKIGRRYATWRPWMPCFKPCSTT